MEGTHLILWTFGAENLLVVRTDSENTSISEGFRGRLILGKRTGSLTITNIQTLAILNHRSSTVKRPHSEDSMLLSPVSGTSFIIFFIYTTVPCFGTLVSLILCSCNTICKQMYIEKLFNVYDCLCIF